MYLKYFTMLTSRKKMKHRQKVNVHVEEGFYGFERKGSRSSKRSQLASFNCQVFVKIV